MEVARMKAQLEDARADLIRAEQSNAKVEELTKQNDNLKAQIALPRNGVRQIAARP